MTRWPSARFWLIFYKIAADMAKGACKHTPYAR